MPCSNFCFFGCDENGECEAWFTFPYLTTPSTARYVYPYVEPSEKIRGHSRHVGGSTVPLGSDDDTTGEAISPTVSQQKSEVFDEETAPTNTSADCIIGAKGIIHTVSDSEPDSEPDSQSGYQSDFWSDAGSSAREVSGSTAGEDLNLEEEDGTQPEGPKLLWLTWKLKGLQELKGPNYIPSAITFVRTLVANFVQIHHGSKPFTIEIPSNFEVEERPLWYPAYFEILESVRGETHDVKYYVALTTFCYIASEFNPYYAEIKKIMSIRSQEIHPVGREMVLAMSVGLNMA